MLINPDYDARKRPTMRKIHAMLRKRVYRTLSYPMLCRNAAYIPYYSPLAIFRGTHAIKDTIDDAASPETDRPDVSSVKARRPAFRQVLVMLKHILHIPQRILHTLSYPLGPLLTNLKKSLLPLSLFILP